MDEYRKDLYEERAEWADLESDIEDTKKRVKVDSWLWKLCNLVERMCRRERADIQAEIDRLNDEEGRMK